MWQKKFKNYFLFYKTEANLASYGLTIFLMIIYIHSNLQ